MNRDYRNEGWNEKRNRFQQDDQYSNWQDKIQQWDENRNRGGFMGSPGSNYAAGTFSGVAYGRGLTEDNYRGYNNMSDIQRNFASNYNAAYGDQWTPSGSRNRDSEERNPASEFGYGGHYGAGGSYGSFGGPASSRINIPDRRNQERSGAYSSDYGWQDNRRSGMEKLTGGHRGKGPRGYRRSDERIQEDVNERLSDDAYVDASGIEVKVENGTIILSGHVPDKEAKRRAEDIAETVRGVTNVENRLRVGEGVMENAAKAYTSGLGDVTVGHDKGRR